MIEFKNVSKFFQKELKLLIISVLLLKKEKFLAFLGPNGAGKSTSLKMMVGILEQTEGKITVNGVDTLENSIEVKEMISYVPDNPDIYTKMTGIKYLNFIADIYGIDEKVRKEKIEEYNQKLELGDAIYSTIDSYSHGMRQKLVLIGALITSPKVLILDEPMVGLDVKTSFNLKNILREFADAGNTVIFSTHVMEVAEKICDKLVIINKGKIAFCGKLSELKTEEHSNEDLEKIFLELTDNEKI